MPGDGLLRIVLGKDQRVAKWVAARIPNWPDTGFGACTGIGVVDVAGHEMAGIVFHDYQPSFKTMSFSLAASTPRWITRRLIGRLLAYPFEQLGVQKLWCATPASNERCLRLAKGLGFTREAVLARHFGKEHAVIMRMFARDFRKLYPAVL